MCWVRSSFYHQKLPKWTLMCCLKGRTFGRLIQFLTLSFQIHDFACHNVVQNTVRYSSIWLWKESFVCQRRGEGSRYMYLTCLSAWLYYAIYSFIHSLLHFTDVFAVVSWKCAIGIRLILECNWNGYVMELEQDWKWTNINKMGSLDICTCRTVDS